MKNYIVWSPERGLPTKTHGGIDAATAEASRLASKHPGVPFHVYSLIGTASASVSVDFQPACPEHWVHYQKPAPEKLAADVVAKGHNPLGLTNAEVGVSEGWRLLEAEELWDRVHRVGDGIEFRSRLSVYWGDNFLEVEKHVGLGWTFRTKNPPGHYLRKY